MKPRSEFLHIIRLCLLVLGLITLPVQNALALGASGTKVLHTSRLPTDSSVLSSHPERGDGQIARSYPLDPSADISWSAGTSNMADIQAAFNNARTVENNQLGTSIPMMVFPSQTEWNSTSDGQKALWLINRERIDRGVMPLHDLESNVSGVAQYYADYLLDNNTWGHSADGRDPWERLSDNPAIGACQDFLPFAENLAVFVTSGSSIPLPVERSIFMWMYEDGDCCNWGHRHAILYYPYNDNGGPIGQEGFLGIGRANGGPYQGPFAESWPFAEIIVMNIFDPCATWTYSFAPGPATLISPSGNITSSNPTYIWNISPDTAMEDPATWYYLYVSGPSGYVFTKWYRTSDVCSGDTCSVPNATPNLAGGSYRWLIQTWNNTGGYGPWSIGMDFSLPASTPPGKATLVSPNGSTTSNPTYTWNKVSEATWYYLYVSGPSGYVFTKWYRAVDVCLGNTCSVSSATPGLGSGSYRWWIQTWNGLGYGPWSTGMDFTVPTPAPPGKATLVSPSGSTTNNPTYTWNQVPDATWYYLYLTGPSGYVFTKWYRTVDACVASTCTVASATPGLASGSYRWWIQTWNSMGYGPWSTGMNFSVP